MQGVTRDTSELKKLIDGYRLVTAEILYRMPDHLDLLQTYVWQDYDLEPRYPVLVRFLSFWQSHLEGPLHSVRIATRCVIEPSEFAHVDYLAHIH